MADRIFPQINANFADLVQRMSSQIERIESAVFSTDRNIQLMTTKLDDLINLLERRQFLENPSTWTGSPAGEENWARKGMFTALDFPRGAMNAKADPPATALHADCSLDSNPSNFRIKKNMTVK